MAPPPARAALALLLLPARAALALSALTDASLYAARDLWLADRALAVATYGHISAWNTSAVTSMAFLFCADLARDARCNHLAEDFDEDISAWDTSRVTSMACERSRARSCPFLRMFALGRTQLGRPRHCTRI